MVGAVVGVLSSWRYGLLIGWMSAAGMFLIWMWTVIARMDAPNTAAHAVREDPGRRLADAAVLGASAASLVAVGLLLVHGAAGAAQDVAAGLSVGSVLLAWGTVHTIYTVRYARLYYTGTDGGVD